MKINYTVAKILGSIAESEALALNVPMCVALADDRGDAIFFGCMDNALPASREIAVSKSYTAAVLRMDTRTVGKLSLPGSPLYGIQNTHGGKIIPFGGGLPLTAEGVVVGGVGISGGSVEEDEAVALPVREAFAEMAGCALAIKKALPEGRLTPSSMHGMEGRIRRRLAHLEEENDHGASILTGAVCLAGSGL